MGEAANLEVRPPVPGSDGASAETTSYSSTLLCLWTGLSLPVALHPASQRRSYLQLRTGQCSRPEGTFTLLLVRTLRRTCPRHFVPGYDRTVPPGRVLAGAFRPQS